MKLQQLIALQTCVIKALHFPNSFLYHSFEEYDKVQSNKLS